MDPVPQTLCLTHVNPSLNMARFYEISIQPTLFGEVAVMRHWGRIGTRGHRMMVTLPDETLAVATLRQLEQQKRRRGYRARD